MTAGTKICEGPDCTRLVHARGLCQAHDDQRRRGKQLAPLQKRKPPRGECVFDGCKRPQKAGGLCTGHYEQKRTGRPLTPIGEARSAANANRKKAAKTPRECSYPGCDVRVQARGLCPGHYGQWRRGRELGPLQDRSTPADRVLAVKEVLGGASLPAAARRHGAAPSTIRRIMEDGAKIENSGLSPEEAYQLAADNKALRNRLDAMASQVSQLKARIAELTDRLERRPDFSKAPLVGVATRPDTTVRDLRKQLRAAAGERDLYREGNRRLVRIMEANGWEDPECRAG